MFTNHKSYVHFSIANIFEFRMLLKYKIESKNEANIAAFFWKNIFSIFWISFLKWGKMILREIKLWLTFLKFPMKSIIWHHFVVSYFRLISPCISDLEGANNDIYVGDKYWKQNMMIRSWLLMSRITTPMSPTFL